MGNRRIGVTDGRLHAGVAIRGRVNCPPSTKATRDQRQEHVAAQHEAAVHLVEPGVLDDLEQQLGRPCSRAPSTDAAISSQQKRMTAHPEEEKEQRESDCNGERGIAGASTWPCRNLRPTANRLDRVPPPHLSLHAISTCQRG